MSTLCMLRCAALPACRRRRPKMALFGTTPVCVVDFGTGECALRQARLAEPTICTQAKGVATGESACGHAAACGCAKESGEGSSRGEASRATAAGKHCDGTSGAHMLRKMPPPAPHQAASPPSVAGRHRGQGRPAWRYILPTLLPPSCTLGQARVPQLPSLPPLPLGAPHRAPVTTLLLHLVAPQPLLLLPLLLLPLLYVRRPVVKRPQLPAPGHVAVLRLCFCRKSCCPAKQPGC